MSTGPHPDGAVAGRGPIAIIGIGCRLPGGVEDPAALWELLCKGTDAVTDVPADRWNWRKFYHPDPAEPGRVYVRQAGFLRQAIDQFDAEFFAMSPREAARLDPQQRLLLEVTWEALEDGGQTLEMLSGSNTGVFIGGFMMDHALSQAGALNREHIGNHTASGSSFTMLSARIAYAFDLRGPTLSVDTACSSSLVATHYACLSLWAGDCSMALAGGVNVLMNPDLNIALCKANMLARDGRCKAFDASADGYARGEGAGLVVLKRLAEAAADGDPIYAVIRATAVNQDGHTSAGISVPDQGAQEAVLRLAYQRAGVPPRAVYYVEAHGTGTAVGDPVEARALGAVLGSQRPARAPLLIGSIKTNIGHLEGASGVTGLIKAALCLKHAQIPPHLHVRKPNPAIPFADLRLRTPRRLQRWPAAPAGRIAGVSSFGFGGTNAHVVLGENPVAAETASSPLAAMAAEGPLLIPMSAGSQVGLRAVVTGHLRHLAAGGVSGRPAFADVGYSLARRRSHLTYRLALVAANPTQARRSLQAFLDGASAPGLSVGRANRDVRPKLVFVFTGMGAQWPGMGRELMVHEPVFRATIQRCEEMFRRYTGTPLWEALAASTPDSGGEAAALANFTLQVALVELWKSWGLVADVVIGHSVGEVAAAHAAGALTLEEAARVCWHRSRLLARAAGMGRMMAVGLGVNEADTLVAAAGSAVEIAAINSPCSVTLSGDRTALDEMAAALRSRGIFVRMLAVNVPYHTHHLDPLRDELVAALRDLAPREPSIPLYSTVTGGAVSAALDADYWWRNLRDCVRFSEAVDQAVGAGADVFLEIGPHPTLAAAIGECFDQQAHRPLTLSSLHRDRPERSNLLGTLGAVYTLGHPVHWDRLHPRGRLVPLPRYPWQRQHHWSESDRSREDRLGPTGHPLLGRRQDSPQPTWGSEVSTGLVPYLEDHRVEGEVVFPASAYLEIAVAAARDLQGGGTTRLERVRFHSALVFKGAGSERLHVFADSRDGSFAIHSSGGSPVAPWVLRASGRRANAELELGQTGLARGEVCRRLGAPASAQEVYLRLQELGYAYGPAFRGIVHLWANGSEALSEIAAPAAVVNDPTLYCFHPALLDGCLHTMILPAAREHAGERPALYLPVGIDRLDFVRRPGNRVWSHVTLRERSADLARADIRVFDEQGDLVLAMHGVQARAWQHQELSVAVEGYRQCWEPVNRPQAAADGARKRWVVIGSPDSLAHGLVRSLRGAGARADLVPRRGNDDGSANGEPRFQWNDRAREDAGVVYVASADGDADPATAIDRAMGDCVGVAQLIQSLLQWRMAPRLWLVTRGAQPVRDGEPVLPAPALLWGIARTAFHEHPDFRTTIVDLAPRPGRDDARALCRELLANAPEEEVGLRGDSRYVHRLQMLDLASSTTPHGELGSGNDSGSDLAPAGLFAADVSYLIAGGLGGFGLATAAWMVEHGARHLALLGRRGAATPGAGPAAEALTRSGASVRVIQADVTDRQQVTRALAEVAATMPVLRGIVDAVSDYSVRAGERALLAQVTPELMRGLMSAKVLGAWNLHMSARSLPLDFFVMFSSIAALIGGVGAGPYIAANAFLDALAHHRRRQRLPALSVNWGAVADVGVLTRHQDLAQHLDVLGFRRLSSRRLLAELGGLLREREVQIGVGSIDWTAFARARPALAVSCRFANLRHLLGSSSAGANGPTAGRNTLLALEPAVRAQRVLERLCAVVARVLESAPNGLEVDVPLAQQGLDSLTCVEVQVGVEQETGVLLPLMSLLKGPTVRQMAAMVLGRLPAGGERHESQDGVAPLASGGAGPPAAVSH